MISLFFHIKNPFHNKHKSPWKGLYERSWKVSKNKVLEIEFHKYMYNLFELNIDLNLDGSDHAGPKFGLAILGFEFNIALFDMRHWDSFDNCWEKE
jgi:hypothetical protein